MLALVVMVRRQTYDPTAKLIISGAEAMPAELLREIVPDGQHFKALEYPAFPTSNQRAGSSSLFGLTAVIESRHLEPTRTATLLL